MVKKKDEPQISARERFEQMVDGRKLKMAEKTVCLDTGVVIHKAAIAQILPWLERTDDESRMDFALHVAFNDVLETQGGKELQREISYKRGNALWDQSVKNIVDSCVEITIDGQLVFNNAVIMEKLEPEERQAMRFAVSQEAGLKMMIEHRVTFDGEQQSAAARRLAEMALAPA
jgi:hypothetical protein